MDTYYSCIYLDGSCGPAGTEITDHSRDYVVGLGLECTQQMPYWAALHQRSKALNSFNELSRVEWGSGRHE